MGALARWAALLAVAALSAVAVGACAPGCGRTNQCIPNCEGVACGDDGCGGSCGTCEGNGICLGGQCMCKPDCTLKSCGDDGCGGSCGTCLAGFECDAGQCMCVPDCAGKECGDDGCWGSCGLCGAGRVCDDFSCCTPNCAGRECGDDGCGGECGTGCPVRYTCLAGSCYCERQCAGKECGDDGCFGSCGECGADGRCIGGSCCQPDCAGKECGPDGCGESCGFCPDGTLCDELGQCGCPWVCLNRECGDDGCGGSCGLCPKGEVCTAEGTCCDPDCDGRSCGSDGCGGTCGECGQDATCVEDETSGTAFCAGSAVSCPEIPGEPPLADQCESDDDCVSGLGCYDICGWKTCRCNNAVECGGDAPLCVEVAPDDELAVCVPGCTPGPEAACPAGLECLELWLGELATPVCALANHTPCAQCTLASDCVVVGDVCVDPDDVGQSHCYMPCPDAPEECPDGYTCGALPDESEYCLPSGGTCP